MGGERRVESTAGRRNGDCGYCYGCYGCYGLRPARETENIGLAQRYIEMWGIILSYNYHYGAHHNHYHCVNPGPEVDPAISHWTAHYLLVGRTE